MPHRIPPETLQQIQDRISLVDLVSEYLTLSKTGQNYKGLCPFHAEKTPSFVVSPVRQTFHCFGCGEGGSLFTFFMKIEGSTFPEAARALAQRAGISLSTASSGSSATSAEARGRLERINQAATAWFQRNLQEPALRDQALEYLNRRGIGQETIQAFGLGYSPASWRGLCQHLVDQGHAPDDLERAGLIVAKTPEKGEGTPGGVPRGYYDRFRGRLMFPILDLSNRVIGFGGRVLDDGLPKYLNSPDTPLFNKSRTLYGLNRARGTVAQEGAIVLVEGYFDVLALHQAGVSNAVATLGTSLTADHVQLCRRFAQRLVLLFDADSAGIKAALRTLDLFVDSGITVQVVSLPPGDDPDTYVRREGAGAFRALQQQAPSLLDFAVRHQLAQVESPSIEDRLRCVDEILRILQKSKNPLEKEEYARLVAERLGVNQKRVIERYPRLIDGRGSARPKGRPEARQAGQSTVGQTNQGATQPFKGVAEERDLAYFLVHDKLGSDELARLRAEAFTNPACRRLVEISLRHRDADGRLTVSTMLAEAMDDVVCGPLVTELTVAEPYFDDATEYISGCLQTLERKRLQRALDDLIIQLRQAEQERRMADVQRLLAEVNDLRVKKAEHATVSTANSRA